MGNSPSSPVDAKTGSEWTYKLYFDPRADLNEGTIYHIKQEDLTQTFLERVDVEEDIVRVEAFRRPLFEWQVTQALSHHLYIVFKTRNWWWSIEKDTEGIAVQRSKEKKWVRDYYKRKSRKTGIAADIEYVDSDDEGNTTVKKLIAWLVNKRKLDKRYNVYTSNCKHFGIGVFKLLAKKKQLYNKVTTWTCKLYFDPRADLDDNEIYRIRDENIKVKFDELVDVSEDIVCLEVLRHSFFEWQVAKQLSRLHLYIVFETTNWWWSIEKDIEGITIQRSKDKKWVRNYYRRESRTTGIGLLSGVVHLVSDKGDKTVTELIDWIYNEDELNKPYDEDIGNCNQFGEAVFKTLAKDKNVHGIGYYT